MERNATYANATITMNTDFSKLGKFNVSLLQNMRCLFNHCTMRLVRAINTEENNID